MARKGRRGKRSGMKPGTCKNVMAKGRKVRVCKTRGGKVRFAKMH